MKINNFRVTQTICRHNKKPLLLTTSDFVLADVLVRSNLRSVELYDGKICTVSNIWNTFHLILETKNSAGHISQAILTIKLNEFLESLILQTSFFIIRKVNKFGVT